MKPTLSEAERKERKEEKPACQDNSSLMGWYETLYKKRKRTVEKTI